MAGDPEVEAPFVGGAVATATEQSEAENRTFFARRFNVGPTRMYITQKTQAKENCKVKMNSTKTQTTQRQQTQIETHQNTINNDKTDTTQGTENTHATILQKFMNRHTIFNESTTPKYQREQTRLLQMMADSNISDTIAAFRHISTERQWCSTTQQKNWAALLNARMLAGSPTTKAEKALLNILTKKAKLRTRWDPTQQSQFSTLDGLTQLLRTSSGTAQRLLRSAALLDFYIGHRLSGLALLEKKNIFTIEEDLVIRVTRGKTISTTGPYTISLPSNSIPSKIVLEALMMAAPMSDFIFIDAKNSWTEEQIGALGQQYSERVRDDIRVELPHWTVRALRRGGLSAMGAAGASAETISGFSTHTTTGSLLRYMADGMYLKDQRARQCETIQRVTSGSEKSWEQIAGRRVSQGTH